MQGQLFTQDFLHIGVRDTPPFQELTPRVFDTFEAALTGIFTGLNADATLNEAQTE